MSAHIEVRLHRVGWCLLAAILSLASCGHTHAAPSPTIEYMTPEVPHVGVDDRGLATVVVRDIPLPPSCTVGCKPPTQTPTATPTPIPIATPPPETVAAESVARPAGLDAIFAEAGWPQALWPWAETIVWRESRGNPAAYNPSGASGLFQVMPSTWQALGCAGDPFDAYANAVCAWAVYRVQGPTAWETNG